MFPSSSRPRAPSTATLRILYQLAYISSGTALGIGALCAEERRRRTTVVQRIADNARRLRQIPQYGRAAALTTLRGSEVGFDNTSTYQPHFHGQTDSVLAPELPSVVAREYDHDYSGHLQAVRKHRRRRDLGRSTEVPTVPDKEEHGTKCLDNHQSKEHGSHKRLRISVARDTDDYDERYNRSRTQRRISPIVAPTVQKDGKQPDNTALAGGVIKNQYSPTKVSDIVEHSSTAIDTGLVNREALALTRLWRRTRNIQPVLRRYESTLESLHHDGGNGDLSKLHQTMTRIALENKTPDQARVSIQQLTTNPKPDFAGLLLASLNLAQHGAWKSVEAQLIGEGRPSQMSVDLSVDNEHTIRTILRLYFHAHDSAEALRFSDSLSTTYDFNLGKKTISALLRKFVSEQRIDLLDSWLSKAHREGSTFKLNGWLASELLRQFVASHRPNHVWLIEQSRDLLAEAPWLACTSLKNLLIQHIAHDIRRNRSQHAWWQVPNAIKRLHILSRTRDISQVPGKVQSREQITQTTLDAILSDFADKPKHRKLPKTNKLSLALQSQKPATDSSTKHRDTLHDTTPEVETASHLALDESSPQSSPTHADSVKVLPSIDDHVTHLQEHSVGLTKDADDMPFGIEDSTSVKQQDESIRALLKSPEVAKLLDYADPVSSKYDLVYDAFGLETAPTSDFDKLRPQYTASSPDDVLDDGVQLAPLARPRYSKLQTHMLTAFSIGNYSQVVTMYHQACTDSGLPPSHLALELVLESSLRLHNGNDNEAVGILQTANQAGMNTACAMGPLLMHRNRKLSWIDRPLANTLRDEVVKYYCENDQNGWPIKHYLAVDTANKLVHAGHPKQAIGILEPVFWLCRKNQRSNLISALQVWLVAYARLKDLDGMQRIVDHVLANNIRIDEDFVHALQHVKAQFQPALRYRQDSDAQQWQPAITRIDAMRHQCIARRAQDKRDVTGFSRLLVAVLVKHAQGLEDSVSKVSESLVKKRLAAKRQTAKKTVPMESPGHLVPIAVA